MTNLLTLATQIEQATEDQQREMLEEACTMIFPKPRVVDEPEWQGPGTLREPLYHAWCVRAQAFNAMLDAKAYESAAIMLVPEERRLLCLTDLGGGQWAAKLWKMPACGGATAALALAAACCRAVAQMGEGLAEQDHG